MRGTDPHGAKMQPQPHPSTSASQYVPAHRRPSRQSVRHLLETCAQVGREQAPCKSGVVPQHALHTKTNRRSLLLRHGVVASLCKAGGQRTNRPQLLAVLSVHERRLKTMLALVHLVLQAVDQLDY